MFLRRYACNPRLYLHLLYTAYYLEVGAALLVLPWLPIWENNYIIYQYPAFRPLVANSFLKGGVLGLGIVNFFIGFQEIAHFRQEIVRIRKGRFSR